MPRRALTSTGGTAAATLLVACLALAAQRGSAQPAQASEQPATPSGGSAQDASAYQDLIDRALREFDLGHWTEALGLFKRAHELEPNARTYRALGFVYYEMRDYAKAIPMLRAALADTRQPLTAAQRTQAEAILKEALAFVARYRVELREGDVLLVDGREVALGPDRELILDAGEHTLTLRAPGEQPLTRQVTAEPGEQRALDFRLPASGAPGTGAPADGGERDEGGRDLTWVWVSAGAAGALLAAGITFTLLGDGAYDDVVDACPPGACDAQDVRREIDSSSGETYDSLAVASYVLSGAAAAAAVTLYLTGERDAAGERAANRPGSRGALAVSLTPSGVRLSGSF